MAHTSLSALVRLSEDPEVRILPHLAFTVSSELGLTAARDLTVDGAGNVFVFDYDDYVIHKFDPTGVAVATFGGSEGEDAGFPCI